MDLTLKSTGTLIDEYITSTLKVAANDSRENKERMRNLHDIVFDRIHGQLNLIQEPYLKLESVLRQCWNAQEEVMSIAVDEDITANTKEDLFAVAHAAKVAQLTNAERNKLIRKIDELLGEAAHSQLAKTYG